MGLGGKGVIWDGKLGVRGWVIYYVGIGLGLVLTNMDVQGCAFAYT